MLSVQTAKSCIGASLTGLPLLPSGLRAALFLLSLILVPLSPLRSNSERISRLYSGF